VLTSLLLGAGAMAGARLGCRTLVRRRRARVQRGSSSRPAASRGRASSRGAALASLPSSAPSAPAEPLPLPPPQQQQEQRRRRQDRQSLEGLIERNDDDAAAEQPERSSPSERSLLAKLPGVRPAVAARRRLGDAQRRARGGGRGFERMQGDEEDERSSSPSPSPSPLPRSPQTAAALMRQELDAACDAEMGGEERLIEL